MRIFFAGLALALVGACGGGDNNVTNPPGTQSHTLTVNGTGDGSGRVATTGGISPALDCAAVNGQSSGACSGDYAEGTSVSLSVTPESGSTFTGWSGDAASCAASTTCNIQMTGSKTATAGFSAAPAPSGAVVVTSSAWYPDPNFGDEGAVNWVVEVRNTSSQTVEVARVDFVSRDASGNELASDFAFVGPIPPGETRAHDGLADYHGTEASADITVDDVQFTSEDQGLGSAKIVSSAWHADPSAGEAGGVVWTVGVQNTSSEELESVQVDFVSYDANGKILDYDFTFVGPLAPGQTGSAEGVADLRGGEANANFQVAYVTVADNGGE
jgi:uncharacterized repeat protein (TIGR02543 family)